VPDGGNLKRRNHTVPKFYLRRFADGNGTLTRVELPGDKRILISVTDAAVMKDFYVVETADGTLSDAAEDAFVVVEEAAAKAIRSLVDDKTWPIPASMRMDIAGWVALQFLRVPSVRKLSDELAEAFRDMGLAVQGDDGKQILMKIDDEGYADVTRPDLHLRFIRDLLAPVTQMLYRRHWIITRYERKRLATSDTPVALIPAADHAEGLGIGIANAGGDLHSVGPQRWPDHGKCWNKRRSPGWRSQDGALHE
jgi:hypothetical protein